MEKNRRCPNCAGPLRTTSGGAGGGGGGPSFLFTDYLCDACGVAWHYETKITRIAGGSAGHVTGFGGCGGASGAKESENADGGGKEKAPTVSRRG